MMQTVRRDLEVGQREDHFGIGMTLREGGWLVSDDIDKDIGLDSLLDAGRVIEYDEKLLKAGQGAQRQRASAAAASASAQAAAHAGGSAEVTAEPTGEVGPARGVRKRE